MSRKKNILCQLSEARFEDVNLVGATMQGCNLSGAKFENSNLEGVVMRESELEGAQFVSCDLRAVDFRKATLLSAVFSSVQVEGALVYGKPPWDSASSDTDWNSVMPSFDGE